MLLFLSVKMLLALMFIWMSLITAFVVASVLKAVNDKPPICKVKGCKDAPVNSGLCYEHGFQKFMDEKGFSHLKPLLDVQAKAHPARY